MTGTSAVSPWEIVAMIRRKIEIEKKTQVPGSGTSQHFWSESARKIDRIQVLEEMLREIEGMLR